MAFVKTPNSTSGKALRTFPKAQDLVILTICIFFLEIAKDYPDIEIVLGAGALNGDMSGSMANMLGIPRQFVKEVYRDLMGKPAFSLVPIIMRPRSRGRLRLKSRNPFQWPKMQPNYLQHPQDLQTLVEGAKFVSKNGLVYLLIFRCN